MLLRRVLGLVIVVPRLALREWPRLNGRPGETGDVGDVGDDSPALPSDASSIAEMPFGVGISP